MCVFCEIIKGNIPCSKVYEDEYVIAFLDLSQATKGHTLVVPKKHVENLFQLDDDTAEHIIKAAIKVANKLKKNLKINDLNMLNNNGTLAGQSVMHYHIHLLPRYENDQLRIEFPNHETDFQQLEKTLSEINK